MKKPNAAIVVLNLTGDALDMAYEGAKANRCTMQQAAQYAMDNEQGSLIDWANNQFPMPQPKRRRKWLAQISDITGVSSWELLRLGRLVDLRSRETQGLEALTE